MHDHLSNRRRSSPILVVRAICSADTPHQLDLTITSIASIVLSRGLAMSYYSTVHPPHFVAPSRYYGACPMLHAATLTARLRCTPMTHPSTVLSLLMSLTCLAAMLFLYPPSSCFLLLLSILIRSAELFCLSLLYFVLSRFPSEILLLFCLAIVLGVTAFSVVAPIPSTRCKFPGQTVWPSSRA